MQYINISNCFQQIWYQVKDCDAVITEEPCAFIYEKPTALKKRRCYAVPLQQSKAPEEAPEEAPPFVAQGKKTRKDSV